ncbi:MAG: hypothetical protein V7K92_08230 [Nostoc sp.]|uniref:hypothetical protein n=1 Tax=Nostoc sp. TaxID=1180 RepID=UPI002FF25F89
MERTIEISECVCTGYLGVAYLRDELRFLNKAKGRFFAFLRLCVRQKSSHQSVTLLLAAVQGHHYAAQCDRISPVICVLQQRTLLTSNLIPSTKCVIAYDPNLSNVYDGLRLRTIGNAIS